MRLLIAAACLGLIACTVHSDTPLKFELVALQVGQLEVEVQLADNTEKRAQGLMGQTPLKHGMLLLNQQAIVMTLWMHNTPAALDVAFINDRWQISQINSMQPFSEQLHASEQAVIAAWEMPQGWFAAQQIKVGMQVRYCPQLPKLCAEAKVQAVTLYSKTDPE